MVVCAFNPSTQWAETEFEVSLIYKIYIRTARDRYTEKPCVDRTKQNKTNKTGHLEQLRFHSMPIRMAKIQNIGDNRCWKVYGERALLLHFWWDHFGNQSNDSLENWK